MFNDHTTLFWLHGVVGADLRSDNVQNRTPVPATTVYEHPNEPQVIVFSSYDVQAKLFLWSLEIGVIIQTPGVEEARVSEYEITSAGTITSRHVAHVCMRRSSLRHAQCT
jgi:hypothetical protein